MSALEQYISKYNLPENSNWADVSMYLNNKKLKEGNRK